MGMMTAIVRRAVTLPQRVPMASPGAGLTSALGGFNQAGGDQAGMNAFATNGWVYSVVSRIASAVARADWDLYALDPSTPGAKGTPLPDHPAAQLWDQWNPLFSQHDALELIQMWLELTGAGPILVVREADNPTSEPVELWPVPPQRIRPFVDRETLLGGYVYSIGAERVILEPSDVIYLRNPDPRNILGGMGPAQSITTDLESDREAALWNRNAFRNGSEPGGVIEFPRELDDREFEQFTRRWREQHQGTSNARRVAVLETAKWVSTERGAGPREMDYTASRRWYRDVVLGAWGISGHMLGISEDVNRANAEAGEVTFSRWVVVPRLDRIKMAINGALIPAFGLDRRAVAFDYDDPTPQDRASALAEARGGYKDQILTKNEARQVLGYGDSIDGEGDTYYSAPSPTINLPPGAPGNNSPGAPVPAEEDEAAKRLLAGLGLVAAGLLKAPDDGTDATDLWPHEMRQVEVRMRREFSRILTTEKRKLLAFIEDRWEG